MIKSAIRHAPFLSVEMNALLDRLFPGLGNQLQLKTAAKGMRVLPQGSQRR
jgi:hypothetical protein